MDDDNSNDIKNNSPNVANEPNDYHASVIKNTEVNISDTIDSKDEIMQVDSEDSKELVQVKSNEQGNCDFLEYMTRNDGSVVCNLCGEIFQNRMQWYRHKYKVHVIAPLNPAPLFQCEKCLVFFKSRKGYFGHLASRHKELVPDTSLVLKKSQVDAASQSNFVPDSGLEGDPELSIPTTTLPNFNTSLQTSSNMEVRKTPRHPKVEPVESDAEWIARRSKEDRLVADIIARVKRECEAQGQGPGAPAPRRGYCRRTTVMHT